MEGYLDKLCKNLGIKLTYVNNKITLLSSSVKNNTSSIRAHSIFKNCPENIAVAIVKYYTDSKNEKENFVIIENYITSSFSGSKFKVEPADEAFKQLFVKSVPVETADDDSLEEISEYRISSIVKTDFYGNASKINPNQAIRPSGDEILELDITVLPSST